MNRNVTEKWSNTPTPHFPRNRFDLGKHRKLFTAEHGKLYPFYCQMVYPGDLWQDNPVAFVRMDTSFRVPLDDIYLDTYFFFVPFRILDENFSKALGDVEPYDDETHDIPQIHLKQPDPDYEGENTSCTFDINCILPYLGYSQASASASGSGFSLDFADDITAYPVAAYYKIWNDWFRDENVDASFNLPDLYGMYCYDDATFAPIFNTVYNKFTALKVNKFHDYFSSGTIQPQKSPGGAVKIPLGTSAPVGITITGGSGVTSNTVLTGYDGGAATSGNGIFPGSSGSVGDFVQGKEWYVNSGTKSLGFGDWIADLSNAAGTINELRLSFAIQALYERRNIFGTRYIEQIRGQWGIDVPDSFFQRPEYLGGSRTTLNNVPVLQTSLNSNGSTGIMSGNSATLVGENAFSKQFVEYGVIIGLCCTRIHHSYGQGKRRELFDIKTGLDLYNPVFANIGFRATKTNELYNQGLSDDSVFNYTEAWTELRRDMDIYAGLFGIFSSNSDLKNKWHYGDYYANKPTFSSTWLKEDSSNVYRTLTGNLITGAAGSGGHQFMIAYYCHPKVTRILPSHSIPVELIGRL